MGIISDGFIPKGDRHTLNGRVRKERSKNGEIYNYKIGREEGRTITSEEIYKRYSNCTPKTLQSTLYSVKYDQIVNYDSKTHSIDPYIRYLVG
ncbi:MAG: hypothetical protein LBR15_03720 [Methanobrevibacter sp.]|nr:hypothetical protein [Candidatus Methanovirga australis]